MLPPTRYPPSPLLQVGAEDTAIVAVGKVCDSSLEMADGPFTTFVNDVDEGFTEGTVFIPGATVPRLLSKAERTLNRSVGFWNESCS